MRYPRKWGSLGFPQKLEEFENEARFPLKFRSIFITRDISTIFQIYSKSQPILYMYKFTYTNFKPSCSTFRFHSPMTRGVSDADETSKLVGEK